MRLEVPGTKGSLLVTDDGFIIASDINEEIDYYEMGKLYVSFNETGKNFTKKIFNSPGIRFSIWNKGGDIQCFPVNNSILLIIISDSDSRPGLLLLRVTKMIEILKEILENEND
ncbi:MAG: hypothetical protein ABFR36_06970 [Acidobacteriota bacterium]